MKRLFKFKYPKLIGLIVAIILSYFIFSNPQVSDFVSALGDKGYLSIFLVGFLFSFGFTAPFAVGFFIVLNPSNMLLAGIVGGIGSTISDLLIFKALNFSFKDEFEKLKKEKLSVEIEELFEKDFSAHVRNYLLYSFAGFILASPLPDEMGLIMLAGLTRIKSSVLAVISFILHTAGILFLLWL